MTHTDVSGFCSRFNWEVCNMSSWEFSGISGSALFGDDYIRIQISTKGQSTGSVKELAME